MDICPGSWSRFCCVVFCVVVLLSETQRREACPLGSLGESNKVTWRESSDPLVGSHFKPVSLWGQHQTHWIQTENANAFWSQKRWMMSTRIQVKVKREQALWLGHPLGPLRGAPGHTCHAHRSLGPPALPVYPGKPTKSLDSRGCHLTRQEVY